MLFGVVMMLDLVVLGGLLEKFSACRFYVVLVFFLW